MDTPQQFENNVESDELLEPIIVTDWEDEEEDTGAPPKPIKGEIINGKEYKPWMFKPGQSGNPKGRPKGKTLKEWCREFLATMTDEERMEFLRGMPKDVIWRMSEGNPTEDKNIHVRVPKPILGGLTQEQIANDTELLGDGGEG